MAATPHTGGDANTVRWDVAATQAFLAGETDKGAHGVRCIDVGTMSEAVPSCIPSVEVSRVVRYRIPKVTADGMCSRPDDLEKDPFELLAIVNGVSGTDEELGASQAVRRLSLLYQIMKSIADTTGSEWVGVYRVIPSPPQARPTSLDERALVKEAYVGSPSRPFFPLTAAFAEHSNNSTVALTRQTVLIHDTRKMDADEPYYVCDGKVRSELCAPILDASGACIGIIDVEAWRPNHFTPLRTAIILDVCAQLGRHNLFTEWLATVS